MKIETEEYQQKNTYDDDMITEVQLLNLPNNGCDDDEEIV